MFIHLHWHSHYSLLEWLGSIGKIVDKAKSLEMEAIALTDYNAMYWAVEFYKAAKKAWIKWIVWLEIGMVQNIQKKDLKEISYNIVLLAQTLDGYQNLMEIVSDANIKWFLNKPTIDISILKDHSKGLIAFMWWEKSLIGQMIMAKDDEKKIIEMIETYKDLFWKDNFFLEITAQDYKKDPKFKLLNDTLISLAEKSSTTMIINNNFHYINKDDKEAYEVLLCIKEWKYIHDSTRPRISQEQHIFTEAEIIDVMVKNWYEESFIQWLIQNNLTVSQSIDMKIPLWQILFPRYESPEYIKEIYEKCKDWLVDER